MFKDKRSKLNDKKHVMKFTEMRVYNSLDNDKNVLKGCFIISKNRCKHGNFLSKARNR